MDGDLSAKLHYLVLIGSLRNVERNRYNNATNQRFHWLNEEKCLHFFDVVCQMTTWNFHIWGSDDNASLQQKIVHFLPLHENHSCQESKSTPRLICTTWPTWNNRMTLNLTQSYNLMWSFRCSSRRSLNSLILNNVLIKWCLFEKIINFTKWNTNNNVIKELP